MAWSEVKKINSDLSKPLDELILGEKRLVGGTSALAIINQNKWFIPKLNGMVSIRPVVQSTAGTGKTIKVQWYDEASNTVYSPEISIEPYATLSNYYFDVYVEVGKKYGASIVAVTSGASTTHNIYVCGQVTDYNYFDTEVIV